VARTAHLPPCVRLGRLDRLAWQSALVVDCIRTPARASALAFCSRLPCRCTYTLLFASGLHVSWLVIGILAAVRWCTCWQINHRADRVGVELRAGAAQKAWESMPRAGLSGRVSMRSWRLGLGSPRASTWSSCSSKRLLLK